MGSSGKAKSQTIGYRYYMSLLMGLGRGPVDEIVQINVGDVRAWPVPDGDTNSIEGQVTVAQGPGGDGVALYENGSVATVSAGLINTISGNGTYWIGAGEIFGGDKREGGVEGNLTVMMGDAAQTVPAYIKGVIGGRVSDFRGVVTLFFDGLICSLNPYPKKWTVRVRRTVSGWDGAVWRPELATIWLASGSIKAMNPMHIIYECLTNRDWGRGYARSWLDDARMTEIAQQLFDENFGLCLRWSRSGELGEFIQMVINHIGGSLFVDRTNGKITMDLLRTDYDAEVLPTFTYSSGLLAIEESDTATQEDVVNEVIVTWRDPIKNQDRSTRVQNLAALHSMEGSKNTSRTDYSGIPVASLADRVAQRDLKAGATALKRFKVTLDRRAWRIVPGKVFRISAPDKDLYNIILRAGKTDSGNDTDGKITVECVLDVFGMPNASFVAENPIEWTPPTRHPQPALRTVVREATYRDLVRSVGPADLLTVANDAGTIAILSTKPTELSQGYKIASKTGGESYETRSAGSFLPSVKLAANITILQSVVSFTDPIELGLVTVGIPVQIGSEICELQAIDSTAMTMTIGRGCVDTVPVPHLADTAIFFMTDEPATDGREYVTSEVVDVKVLPFTSTNTLDISAAAVKSVQIIGRQARPWPPSNVRINGAQLGAAVPSVSGDVVFTWGHRDRLSIQDRLYTHDFGSTGEEPGTTYTFRVFLGASTTPVRTESGISGTTWTYTNDMAAADGVTGDVTFELRSSRDGLTSYQRYMIAINQEITGYGTAYGDFYGA